MLRACSAGIGLISPFALADGELFPGIVQFAFEKPDDALLLAKLHHRVAHHVRAEHRHEFVILPSKIERIGELERMLEIDIVVSDTVDEQQRARKLRGISRDVAYAIGLGRGGRNAE